MRRTRSAAAGIALVAVIVAIAGCSTGGTSDPASAGSRAALYDSIDDLAADSTAIVGGTVTEQSTQGDTTVSVILVGTAPSSPQLGANLSVPLSDIRVGDTVQVRQDPSSRPLLEIGEEYFLWLTPSALPGAAASQFFITGSNAGIYVRDGDVARRVAPDSGDTLPATITIAGAPD